MALLPTDPAQQKKLLVGLVPFILAAAYFNFVHKNRVTEIETLESNLELLERTNAAAKVIAEQGGPELQRRLAIYESHMKRLEQLIPLREQVPELLHAMGMRAQTSGVELTRMKPEAETVSPYYTRQTYEIGVRGTYHDVGLFLSEVGSLPRIITPTELKLMGNTAMTDKTGTPLLNANFRIMTYIVPEPGQVTPDSARANVKS
jgi:type IV pilus assembly protein PilO